MKTVTSIKTINFEIKEKDKTYTKSAMVKLGQDSITILQENSN